MTRIQLRRRRTRLYADFKYQNAFTGDVIIFDKPASKGDINMTESPKTHLHETGAEFTKTLTVALSEMLRFEVVSATCETTVLNGGTIAEVLLFTGVAYSKNHEQPFKIVRKKQKKWERYGDPLSWRREYDLLSSKFTDLFTEAFRIPAVFHLVMNEDETEYELWMEYIEGISGADLSPDMYEQAALELGRFQGRLYTEKPDILQSITNLSDVDFCRNFYLYYRSWKEVYDYIRSETCELPKHICQMIIDFDENEDEVWQHIRKLLIVFCHRDFWVCILSIEKYFHRDVIG